jgi:RNA polymerase sigma-70 factor (ECF subfamily)
MLFSILHTSTPPVGVPIGQAASAPQPSSQPSGQPSLQPSGQGDIEIVRAMAAGDSGAALTRFYQRFAGTVMALLLRMLGSRAEAEELLQEVFIELWRRAGQYDPGRAAVSTWVVTIARSRALDALRARARRGGDMHMSAEDISVAAPSETRPDQMIASSSRTEAVHRALAEISGPQREVLELSYFEGLSHSEIAERLSLPVGTVKSRILGAMKTLRTVLAPVHDGRIT